MVVSCKTSSPIVKKPNYASETLELQQLTPNVYQHISFLQTQSFGKVACNGMVVIDQNEAIIFDTPSDDASSLELIDWVEKELHCTIKAIIPTHFHTDCLGGLSVFHDKNIPSYANNHTISLAKNKGYALPENGFENELELTVGKKKVVIAFVGEGHTKDNVVGYVYGEKVLFGGCLVKELSAGKGNLEDANVIAWPKTMKTLMKKYPDMNVVIPGHGTAGNQELLQYTKKLFSLGDE